MNLDALTSQVDEVFFIIGGLILLIELAEMFFKGEHRVKTIAEMLVSASTQIPYIVVETFILTGAYSLYWIIASALPWSIPAAHSPASSASRACSMTRSTRGWPMRSTVPPAPPARPMRARRTPASGPESLATPAASISRSPGSWTGIRSR